MSTALDRYRAAKLALDTFDAFTKDMLRADTEVHPGHGSKLSVMSQIQTENRNRSKQLQSNMGFNGFLAEHLVATREELAAEYRKVLVAKVKETKEVADAEAVATIREEAPQ